jgi:hypothetical protein
MFEPICGTWLFGFMRFSLLLSACGWDFYALFMVMGDLRLSDMEKGTNNGQSMTETSFVFFKRILSSNFGPLWTHVAADTLR